MGLRNISLPTRDVEISDGVSFSVRGLSPQDALGLYFRYTGTVSAMFDQLAEKYSESGAVAVEDVNQITVALLADAPMLLAEIVAIGSGEKPTADDFDEMVEIAKGLPAGAQLDALSKIGELTFTSAMPPGKFGAALLKMLQAVPAQKSISQT